MTIVYEELGAISRIKEILEREKPASILLVRGNASYETSGAKRLVEPQLSGYNVTFLSGFSMYPSLDDVQRAIDVIKEKEIDFIIAIGGGTVMDVAKSASILYNGQDLIENYVTGKQKLQGVNIKRILIPTNAGTGAEITPYSSIYIGKMKYSLAYSTMVPDYVILAPELTYNLTPRLTAEIGYDALAQAIEGFWSANATDESKKYSSESIPLILDNLNKAVNNPTPESRRAMLIGSHLAGKSIAIAKTTAAHAISHTIMTYFNIPHGHAVLLTLPYFFPINEDVTRENVHENLTLEYAKKTFNELLSLLRVRNGEEARDMLLKLADEIHLERKLSSFGVKEKDVEAVIDEGFNPKIGNNPVKVTKDMVGNILKNLI
jgi:alcohol dehydrogenase class IV